MKMRVQGFVIFNTQWAVAVRFSWTTLRVFGKQNILSTTTMFQFTKRLLVRKIAEILVVYSMDNKWIPKGTLPGQWLFIPNSFPFTTEFVAFQELLKLKIFPICSYSTLCDLFRIWLDHSGILLAHRRWLIILAVTDSSTLLPNMLRVRSICDLLSKTWYVHFEEIVITLLATEQISKLLIIQLCTKTQIEMHMAYAKTFFLCV